MDPGGMFFFSQGGGVKSVFLREASRKFAFGLTYKPFKTSLLIVLEYSGHAEMMYAYSSTLKWT
jgi:hypothetical protein